MLYDARWIGPHGIGRFASEIFTRLNADPYCPQRKPLGMVDPFLTSAELLKRKPSLYISPGFNAIVGRPCPFVLSIHDLIHLDTDEANFAKRLYYNRFLRPSLRSAEYVLTVSQFSKRKICDWSGIDDSKVIVVGNGVNSAFSPEGPKKQWRKPYLLYVGNHKPHKNIPMLMQAYAHSQIQPEFDLLLTGTPSGKLMEAVRACKVSEHVHFLGMVPEGELPGLYRGAHALVMPSIYEGFGLPIVEAMACGTPVISSNCASLPEVGGGAALYFDAKSMESFIDALDMTGSASLMEKCARLGVDHAKRFTWDDVASKVQCICKQFQ